MTCKGCSIEMICQNKANPAYACIQRKRPGFPPRNTSRNGYNMMAKQEQMLRMGAIEFKGDW